MSAGVLCHHVLMVVFNDMTDVFDTVRTAPVTELISKVFGIQRRDDVHIGNTRLLHRLIVGVKPQGRQHFECLAAELFIQLFHHLVGIREVRILSAKLCTEACSAVVAEARLIGEKARKRIAEIAAVMLPMRFIYGFQIRISAKRRDLIAILNLMRIEAGAGLEQEEHTPGTFGDIKIDHIIL